MGERSNRSNSSRNQNPKIVWKHTGISWFWGPSWVLFTASSMDPTSATMSEFTCPLAAKSAWAVSLVPPTCNVSCVPFFSKPFSTVAHLGQMICMIESQLDDLL